VALEEEVESVVCNYSAIDRNHSRLCCDAFANQVEDSLALIDDLHITARPASTPVHLLLSTAISPFTITNGIPVGN